MRHPVDRGSIDPAARDYQKDEFHMPQVGDLVVHRANGEKAVVIESPVNTINLGHWLVRVSFGFGHSETCDVHPCAIKPFAPHHESFGPLSWINVLEKAMNPQSESCDGGSCDMKPEKDLLAVLRRLDTLIRCVESLDTSSKLRSSL